MIHVKYKLKESTVHGIGLFADEDIRINQLVYTASPLLDTNISSDTFDKLTESEKREIKWWGFWDKQNNVWHVDFDVSKFINHSTNPTLTQDIDHKDAYLVATKDIKTGEELTQNYLEFESESDLLNRGIK